MHSDKLPADRASFASSGNIGEFPSPARPVDSVISLCESLISLYEPLISLYERLV
jgi:hypothetical protein